MGYWTSKNEVCLDITIKNDNIFSKKLFWNFDVSEKKSADFSCLFTFFQNKNFSLVDLTMFWGFHKFCQNSDVCLHFQTNNKVDLKIFSYWFTFLRKKISVSITFDNILRIAYFSSHNEVVFCLHFGPKIFRSILLLVWKCKKATNYC